MDRDEKIKFYEKLELTIVSQVTLIVEMERQHELLRDMLQSLEIVQSQIEHLKFENAYDDQQEEV